MKNSLLILKKSCICSLTSLFLVAAFTSMNVNASNDEHTGIIQFSGAIVFPSCINEINEKNIKMKCLNSQSDMVTNKIDLNDVTNIQGWKVINDGRGEYSYNWVNEDKQMGMLTIKYI
ncbi:hypothetical protein [Providencia sp. SP181]|uniref:hypothetical protein n=1 Tax=Providencia sp. SP181 TaxID=3136277 RepID=UPI003D2DE92A